MNNQIKFWNKTFTNRTPTLHPYDGVVSFIYKNYPKDKKKKQIKVLDIGCAGGNNLLFIAELGFDVYGIDGSENAIKIAKKRFEERNLFAKLFVGNFEKLPFSSDFFDLIIDRCSVCCIDKLGVQKTLEEIKRVLLPGGAFYSLAYADDHTSAASGQKSKTGITTEIRKGSLKGFGNLSFFSKKEIDELFSEGWDINRLIHKSNRDMLTKEDIHSEWEIIVIKKR